jgi:hypothetical protein
LQKLADCCECPIRAFNERKVPAILEDDETGPRNGIGNLGGDLNRNEIGVSVEDQRWDAEIREFRK